MDINDKAHKRNEEWKVQMRLYKEMDPDYRGMNWKDDYVLDDDEWKNDPIPEMMDGKNVYDYWENNNDEKLESLEREEAARLRSLQELYQEEDVSRYKLTPEQQEKVKRIREKRKLIILDSRQRRAINKPIIPKKYNTKNITVTDLEAHLESLGMDSTLAAERLRSLSISRDRSVSRNGRVRERASSESRALSKTPLPGEGYRNVRQRIFAEDLSRKNQKLYTRDGRMGEADRHIYDLKPKHLFSGKRSNGKTDRR
jgi:nucleolar GTP-binding protein